MCTIASTRPEGRTGRMFAAAAMVQIAVATGNVTDFTAPDASAIGRLLRGTTAAGGVFGRGRGVGPTPCGWRVQPRRGAGSMIVGGINVVIFCSTRGPGTAEMLNSRVAGISVYGGTSRYMFRLDYY